MTKVKKIMSVISIFLFAAGIFFYSVTVAEGKIIPNYRFGRYKNEDNIHFLATGKSDCIIIESEGEYMLVDCGFGMEWIDPDNEIPEIPASESSVPYIRRLSDGNEISFKYVVATHTHKDHLSGLFDIADADFIKIDRFIIKDSKGVGNKRVYEGVIKELSDRGIPIDHNVECRSLTLGNFEIEILNGAPAERKGGDNDNSLALLVKHGETKTLLAGDLTNFSKDEINVAKAVGDIDLLKVAHHGYGGSSAEAALKHLTPEAAIVTNYVIPNEKVEKRLIKYCTDGVYLTEELEGIVACYGEGGINLYAGSCRYLQDEDIFDHLLKKLLSI